MKNAYNQHWMPGDLYNNRDKFDSRKLLNQEYQCSYGEIKTVFIRLFSLWKYVFFKL